MLLLWAERAGDPAHPAVLLTGDRLAPLSAVTAPTLVINGTQDPLPPLPHGQALAERIPGARLHVVEGMGHGFCSPGPPARIADLIFDHTAG